MDTYHEIVNVIDDKILLTDESYEYPYVARDQGPLRPGVYLLGRDMLESTVTGLLNIWARSVHGLRRSRQSTGFAADVAMTSWYLTMEARQISTPCAAKKLLREQAALYHYVTATNSFAVCEWVIQEAANHEKIKPDSSSSFHSGSE